MKREKIGKMDNLSGEDRSMFPRVKVTKPLRGCWAGEILRKFPRRERSGWVKWRIETDAEIRRSFDRLPIAIDK